MSLFKYFLFCFFFLCSCQGNVNVENSTKSVDKQSLKLDNPNGASILERFNTPEGYERVALRKGTFGNYLRMFPLKDAKAKVKLFDGSDKPNQGAHVAVLDIDVGSQDLQQCADAVMRLRAEYFFNSGQKEKIAFNFTNGFKADFKTWSKGNRILVSGNNVSWTPESTSNSSYNSYRKYMRMVFAYAGTASLEKELKSKDLSSINVGDILIKGGYPGHAVIVMDVAKNINSGDKIFMLAQSYMPAQDIHILKNPSNRSLSPWYSVTECEDVVKTPEWTFNKKLIKSF